MPHRAFTPVRKERMGGKSNITSNRDACYEEKQAGKRMARDWESRDLLIRKVNLQVQVTGLIERHLSLTWPLCDQSNSSLCSIITQVN